MSGADGAALHIETTARLLEELALESIPRIVVFNKVELLAPLELALLQKRFPDSVLLSARERETTLPLVERMTRFLR